jgi:hypothetical protein
MAGLDECGQLNITQMSYDNIVVSDNKSLVWVKAEVEEKIFIYNDTPCVVIKFDAPCLASMCTDAASLPKALIGAADNLGIMDKCGNNGNNANPAYSQSTSLDMNSGKDLKARTIRKQTTEEQQKAVLDQAKTAVDIRQINNQGFQAAAVIPFAIAIPMRSNILTYGPYASPNFGSSNGGTQVETNGELCPWVFGSIASMNEAGESIVNSSTIGLIKAETGQVTIPGMPISSLSSLGVALGGAGPTLTGMNFSFGSNGITTSYDFRTFTPKFGSLNRHILDKIKDISKNRTEQLRFLRNNNANFNKALRKLKTFTDRFESKQGDDQKGALDKNSMDRVILGEIYDWQSKGQRTIVGGTTLAKSVGEMIYAYDKKAYMSWDGLFGPISKAGDGDLPRFAAYETGCSLSSSDLPQPPYTIKDNFNQGLDEANVNISQKYLDPLTNKFEKDQHHHSGEGRGHSIDLVAHDETVPTQGLITNFYRLDDENRYSDDYRFIGMRGPIVLHSWGYDTQGKPIPNEIDIENDTKTGKFKKEDLKDKFLSDWLGKPATWPVAPIDFRFDRKRGVWVSPPGYKVVVAILDEKLIPYGTAKASLVNKDETHDLEFGPEIYDKNGQKVKATDKPDTDAKIKISERIGGSYPVGTKMYCYYDTFKCEYIVIEAIKPLSIRFRLIDLCEYTPVDPDYGDDWTKHSGYGDKFPNNHILGIRINCEGDPIDIKGNLINNEDIQKVLNEQVEGDDTQKRAQIFINLFDTCGRFGSAYSYYNINGGLEGFNEWKSKAATGFGLLCDPDPSTTCVLGEQNSQCSPVRSTYNSYDIVFLDQYARFVECELTQPLYMTDSNAQTQFPNDEYKNIEPSGNASATIQHFYGDSGNGIDPKFYKKTNTGLSEIEFRVFDPFKDHPQHLNPFAKLTTKDKVLAVFDENRKKYIIYNSLRKEDKVIKFALVDNKDIGDRISRAVLVDLEGYPIDKNGKRLTQANFANNFITVFDSFAIHGYSEPVPKYHNWGTTGFGPALGSDKFNEHINGIPLKAGDWNPPDLPGGDSTSVWKGGPFIGYAIEKAKTDETSYDFAKHDFHTEIIYLEHFAEIVVGKIASTKPTMNFSSYLAVLKYNDGGTQGGFIDGRIPFTRDQVHNRANLAVNYPLNQYPGGKFITGDFFEGDNYNSNDVYNNVDGCLFIAKLDHVSSKVNDPGKDERLYYSIIEVEHVATKGKTAITKDNQNNQLNDEKITEQADPDGGVKSIYLDGFMWNKVKSKNKYELTTIYNRLDWVKKGLIPQYNDLDMAHIRTGLIGYDQDTGAITYQLDYAGTIAQIGEATVPSNLAGLFGVPEIQGGPTRGDTLIGLFDNTKFYHGISPLDVKVLGADPGSQPSMVVSSPWMAYEGSNIVSLWDETDSSFIEQNKYRVVYAREAPVIITGRAYTSFRPETAFGIQIMLDPIFASCPGVGQNPIPDLLINVQNPMGYGAQSYDFVTLQRVYTGVVNTGANYYYMVIGTSQGPSPCS